MRRIATCVALLGACSSPADERRTGPPACPALEVTVDEQPLPALAHGLARGLRRSDALTYEVHVFDRPGATCAQLLDRSPRAAPPGEVSVRAFSGASGRGIAIDAWTQAGGKLGLLTSPPKQTGDTVTICVREPFTIEPGIGAYRDKRVTVRGAFTGTYCGELAL